MYGHDLRIPGILTVRIRIHFLLALNFYKTFLFYYNFNKTYLYWQFNLASEISLSLKFVFW